MPRRFHRQIGPGTGLDAAAAPARDQERDNSSLRREKARAPRRLHGQLHDRVHDVAVVRAERLDGLGPRAGRLGHDQFHVLGLEAALVQIAALVLLGDRGRSRGRRRAAAHALLRGLELRRRLLLRLGRQVLDLRLAEDDVRVRRRALEDVRVADREEDVLRLLHGDAHDVGHGLHAELLHGLAVLLLGAVLLRAAFAGSAGRGRGLGRRRRVLLVLEGRHAHGRPRRVVIVAVELRRDVGGHGSLSAALSRYAL